MRNQSRKKKKKKCSRGVFIQVRGETSFVEVIALSRIRRTRDGRLSALARSLSLVPLLPRPFLRRPEREKRSRSVRGREVLHKLDVSRIFPARRRASGLSISRDKVARFWSDTRKIYTKRNSIPVCIRTYAELNNSAISDVPSILFFIYILRITSFLFSKFIAFCDASRFSHMYVPLSCIRMYTRSRAKMPL